MPAPYVHQNERRFSGVEYEFRLGLSDVLFQVVARAGAVHGEISYGQGDVLVSYGLAVSINASQSRRQLRCIGFWSLNERRGQQRGAGSRAASLGAHRSAKIVAIWSVLEDA